MCVCVCPFALVWGSKVLLGVLGMDNSIFMIVAKNHMVKAAVNLYVAWDLTIFYKVDEKELSHTIVFTPSKQCIHLGKQSLRNLQANLYFSLFSLSLNSTGKSPSSQWYWLKLIRNCCYGTISVRINYMTTVSLKMASRNTYFRNIVC